jgi:prophage DNA circulation protein
MSWRDRLQRATFRGVFFHVELSALETGRRVAVHEFPGREIPQAEDLGRKARAFTVEAFVLGPDYDTDRDALRLALEQRGPGTLVHPRFGRMTVQAGTVSLRETTAEGGMAVFSIAFHEVSDLRAATAPDTQGRLRAAAAKSIAESIADFGKKFSALGMAADLVRELERNVSDVLSAVENLTTDVANNVAAVIRSPANLAALVAGSLNRLRAAVNTPLDAFNLYQSLFGATAKPAVSPYNTPTRQRQAASRAALEQLVRRIAVGEAATSLAEAEFESTNQAARASAALTGAIDALQADAPDALFGALVDLRAAAVRDVAARGANLAQVVRHTPPVTLPALVIAHQLHGDATREGEIAARNKIAHPGFVPGGTALEVLTDGG